jgi:hypothetical protein
MAALTPSAGSMTFAPSTGGGPTPMFSGNQAGLGALNQALQSNSLAYGGQANALQNQYQQNAANTQQGLVNSGLGNTTVAQNMMQTPLQSYNNSMLNLLGQKQGAATGIYETGANLQSQDYLNQLNNATAASRQQGANTTAAGISGANAMEQSQQNAQNVLNSMAAMGGGGGPINTSPAGPSNTYAPNYNPATSDTFAVQPSEAAALGTLGSNPDDYGYGDSE